MNYLMVRFVLWQEFPVIHMSFSLLPLLTVASVTDWMF